MTMSDNNDTQDKRVNEPTVETPAWNKAELRDELARDVERWLAQGNAITEAPPAQNDRNGRRVEVHGAGYYF